MAERKFPKLWESAISRYTQGGFLAGDLVKLKPNFWNHKSLGDNPNLVDELKGLLNSGNNLRVTNVKNKYPTAMGGDNTDYKGMECYVDIAPEIIPGKFGCSYTVHPAILELITTYPELSPIPDKMKYKNKIKIKPEEPKEENEEVPFYGPGQTKKSYVGDKLSKGDRELGNKNVTIPSVGPKEHKTPASDMPNYTQHYMHF